MRPWSHGAGSECSVLIYYGHNSHSLFSYSVDLALEVVDHGHMRLTTQRWYTATQERENPQKQVRPSNDRNAATPNTVASIASDVCGDILSPVIGKMYQHNSSEEITPTNLNDSEAGKKSPGQPDIEEGIQVKELKSQETNINIQSSLSSSHQPISQPNRLACSTSREREARLAPDARVTRSQSAKRVNTPVTTPRTTQHNLTPNSQGRQRPVHGKGKSKTRKPQDFRRPGPSGLSRLNGIFHKNNCSNVLPDNGSGHANMQDIIFGTSRPQVFPMHYECARTQYHKESVSRICARCSTR